jgi:hypothetical protein
VADVFRNVCGWPVSRPYKDSVRTTPEVSRLYELTSCVRPGGPRGCFQKLLFLAEQENLDRKLALRYSSESRSQRGEPPFKVLEETAALDLCCIGI